MELAELIRSRRTVHNYTDKKVDWSIVEEALALSLWAPNHKLSFPWVYTRIGPKSREELADLAVELKEKKGELGETKRKAIHANIIHPAHVISLGIRLDDDERRRHEDFATLACSVQIASLYLWQKGIATKWSTGGNWSHKKTYKILDLNPDKVRLEGALLIGMAESMPKTPARPDIEKVLRIAK